MTETYRQMVTRKAWTKSLVGAAFITIAGVYFLTPVTTTNLTLENEISLKTDNQGQGVTNWTITCKSSDIDGVPLIFDNDAESVSEAEAKMNAAVARECQRLWQSYVDYVTNQVLDSDR